MRAVSETDAVNILDIRTQYASVCEVANEKTLSFAYHVQHIQHLRRRLETLWFLNQHNWLIASGIFTLQCF